MYAVMAMILFGVVAALGGIALGAWLRDDEAEERWRAAWLDRMAEKYGEGR